MAPPWVYLQSLVLHCACVMAVIMPALSSNPSNSESSLNLLSLRAKRHPHSEGRKAWFVTSPQQSEQTTKADSMIQYDSIVIKIQLTISLFAHAMFRYAVLRDFCKYIVSAFFWSTAALPKDHLAAATLRVQTLGSRSKRSSSRLPTISNAKIYAKIIKDCSHSDCLTSSGWFGRMLLAFRTESGHQSDHCPAAKCSANFRQIAKGLTTSADKRRTRRSASISKWCLRYTKEPQKNTWNTYLQPAWWR